MNGKSKIILIFLFVIASALTFAEGIKWQTDLATALKIAKKAKKPILVDFYGEH